MTEKPDKIKKKPRVSSKAAIDVSVLCNENFFWSAKHDKRVIVEERKQSWSSGRLETIKKKLDCG